MDLPRMIAHQRTNFIALREWVAAHRPDLANRLGLLDPVDCLPILNAETGLDIKPGDDIEKTSRLFLDALKSLPTTTKANHDI